MRAERMAWAGNVLLAALAIYLAAAPIAGGLGVWVVIGIAVITIGAAILLFPYSKDANEQPDRIGQNVLNIRGHKNRVQIGNGDGSKLIQAGRDITVTEQPKDAAP